MGKAQARPVYTLQEYYSTDELANFRHEFCTAVLPISSFGIDLPMSEIYRRLDLPEGAEN